MDTKRIATGLIALMVLVVLVLTSMLNNGFWSRLASDFWPLDRSVVGPNLVASVVQWLVVAIIATLVYPPFRKWVEHELDHLHAKIDHMIEHNPNVKDLPEHLKGRMWSIHHQSTGEESTNEPEV